MGQFILQSSFQFGEVSDLLHAQVNSPIYMKAARRLRNVVVIPQGGVTKRFGTKYIGTITGATTYQTMKPTFFEHSDGSIYYLVFTANEIAIWNAGAAGAAVAAVVTTYLTTEVASLDFAQSGDALVIMQADHAPAILTRTSAHAGWNLDATPTYVHYPTYDFEQNYDTFNFSVVDITTAVALTTAENLLGRLVTLTSSSAVFTADHVGGLYFGDSGTLRITAYTNTTNVSATIVQVFDVDSNLFHTTFIIAGDESVLTEKAFSTTRGYPSKVTFFQNRLWFGNTSSLNGGLWGTNFNGYTATSFDFNDANALDTSAISTVINGDHSVQIESLTSFKSLIVMTNKGLYSSPLFVETPLTPSNIDFINKQTSDSSNTVNPVAFDNQVLFFSKGGTKVKNLAIADNSYNYQSQTISVLAPHLVDQPYSSAVYQNSDVVDGSWLLMVNSGSSIEGALSIYQNVPEQSVTAWSLADTKTDQGSTDAYFRHVSAVDETVYFIVERTVNSLTVFFIEQLDFTLNTDSAFTATYGMDTTTITGLDHLELQSVTVKGDGAPVTDANTSYTVVNGEIELADGVTSVEVGLKFEPLVRPMPLNVPMQQGPSIYLPKTINIVYVDYFESVAITVDGTLIPPYQFGEDKFDTEITPKTGFSLYEPFKGWDPRQNIDIGQTAPMPFTIIGVGYDVTV